MTPSKVDGPAIIPLVNQHVLRVQVSMYDCRSRAYSARFQVFYGIFNLIPAELRQIAHPRAKVAPVSGKGISFPDFFQVPLEQIPQVMGDRFALVDAIPIAQAFIQQTVNDSSRLIGTPCAFFQTAKVASRPQTCQLLNDKPKRRCAPKDRFNDTMYVGPHIVLDRMAFSFNLLQVSYLEYENLRYLPPVNFIPARKDLCPTQAFVQGTQVDPPRISW